MIKNKKPARTEAVQTQNRVEHEFQLDMIREILASQENRHQQN